MRRYMLIPIILLMTTLTGCVHKYEYTDQQSDAAAEYIAGVVLKNDKSYEAELVSFEKIIEKQEAEVGAVIPEPEDTQNLPSDQENIAAPAVTKSPVKDFTLTEVINEKGFEIEYSDFIVTESYPEDATEAYFLITARPDNKLVVLSFKLKNTQDKNNRLNLTKSNIVYQLDVNDGTIYEPPFVLLENNLKLIDLKLKAGEEKSVVLIFEVKKATDLAYANLVITRDNRSETIKVK